MTTFASHQGQFKAASSMYASKGGLWVPLEQGPPPQQPFDPWNLADWQDVPMSINPVDCFPATGWAATWNGKDLVFSLPAPVVIWLSDWTFSYMSMPAPPGLEHPHQLNPIATALSHTIRWSCSLTPDYAQDWGMWLCWTDPAGSQWVQAGTIGIGRGDAGWNLPLSIPESKVTFYPSTPETFGLGTIDVCFMSAAPPGTGTAQTLLVSGEGSEWGFSELPPLSAMRIAPPFSPNLRTKVTELLGRDNSDLPAEQQAAVENMRRLVTTKPLLRKWWEAA